MPGERGEIARPRQQPQLVKLHHRLANRKQRGKRQLHLRPGKGDADVGDGKGRRRDVHEGQPPFSL